MLNQELNTLQEELQYHCKQVEELEERIAQVKVYDSYAAQAKEAVEEAIKQIGVGKYLWLFKEELLSMFPQQAPQYLEDKVKEAPQEIIESDTTVSEEVEEKKEFGPLSYYELTGKPDTRPDTFTDLAPNITYSSSGRAYVGFNNKQEAEKFRDSISEPSMLSDTETMNGYKYEVKFYCDLEYLQHFVAFHGLKEEQIQKSDFEQISSSVIYNHNDSIAYLAFSAKGRADTYGSYLIRILDIAKKYTVSNKPQIVKDSKYELRLEEINLEDATHLANFNLKKDYDHPDHREVREVWRTTRKREVPPAYKPLARSVPLNKIELGEIVSVGSNSKQYKVIDHVELDGVPHLEVISTYNSDMPELVGQTSYLKEAYRVLKEDIHIDPELVKDNSEAELSFPAPPYKEIPLDQVELCDVVATSPNSQSAYEVKEHKGSYIVTTCLYHNALPNRIGEEFTFSDKVYLIEKSDNSMPLAS